MAVTLMHQAMIFLKGCILSRLETNKSSPISLLFSALFDLIICRTAKSSLLIPCASEGRETRDLDAIFA